MAMMVVAGPASAKTESPIPSVTIVVPLELDCSSVPDTPEARRMLKANGLCGNSKRDGGVTTNATVVSNCGSLSLNVFNSGGGFMQWKAEITSSLGPFTSAAYGGSWDNFQAGFGVVGRNYGPGITADWLDIFPIQTGPGHVVGQINWAWTHLWWGPYCTSSAVVGASTNVT